MAANSGNRLQNLVQEKLQKTKGKKTDLHRQLSRALGELQSGQQKLVACFERRAQARLAATGLATETKLAAARADFETLKTNPAVQPSGNVAQDSISRNLLLFAEMHIQTIANIGEKEISRDRQQNAIEAELVAWLEGIALNAVESIDSDKAGKRANAAINAGLVLGGLATVPYAPPIAALLSIVILARSVAEFERGSDVEASVARLERALRYIGYVNHITSEWLRIVGDDDC